MPLMRREYAGDSRKYSTWLTALLVVLQCFTQSLCQQVDATAGRDVGLAILKQVRASFNDSGLASQPEWAEGGWLTGLGTAPGKAREERG